MVGTIWRVQKLPPPESDSSSVSEFEDISFLRDNSDNALGNDISALALYVTISAENLLAI